MPDVNGMFELESVTEQDFGNGEDFFDAVMAAYDTTPVTKNKNTTVLQNGNNIICSLQNVGESMLEPIAVVPEIKKTAEKTDVSNDGIKLGLDVQAIEQRQELSEAQEENSKQEFKNVDEVINDNIVLVPEEINITKYKGGTVLPREQIEQLIYPCLYIRTDNLPAYKATALKALLSRGVFDGDSVIYVCYLDYQGTVMQLGYLDNKVMREMIRSSIFADLDVVVYLSENKQIGGVYLNALCAV